MIKFFRKIRQRLLTENKFSKYMLYAIGEIVLVVLGILIALSINNWNEEKNDKAIEQDYLISLKDEFEFNLLELNEFIDLNQNIMEATRDFLNYTGPDATDSSEIAQHLGGILGRSVGYEPNPGVLEDMINSGNLSKITNEHLRRSLSTWKADLVKSEKQEDKIKGYRDEITQLFIENGPMRNFLVDTLHIDYSKFNLTSKLVLQDPEFENNLAFFMITSNALHYVNYPQLKTDILEILNLINREIK